MAQLKNYMEDCVVDLIEPVLSNMGACTCDICKLDVLAMVLNEVKPKYVVTRKGTLYTRLDVLQNQFNVDIVMSLTKAAKIVSANPRHEE